MAKKHNALRGVLALFLSLALAGLCFALFYHRGDEVREGVKDVAEDVGEFFEGKAHYVTVPLDKAMGRQAEPPRIIYLNREGATLRPGTRDDAQKNRSTMIRSAGLASFEVAAFTGSDKRWRTIKSCLEKQFSAYDLEVVDRRPVEGDYLMVMMGGRPGALKTHSDGHEHLLGLAPFSGGVIQDAIVLVFTRELGNRSTRTCETAAMEIAHAYGLDHTRLCSDVMTYKRSCVKVQHFAKKDAPCGESKNRTCKSGKPTQNSHQMLLNVLGPHKG